MSDSHPITLASAAKIAGLPRRGLSRTEAALYVGIGATKFDQMVADKRMPAPFRIDGRVLWDIRDLDSAVDVLKEDASENPWDNVT